MDIKVLSECAELIPAIACIQQMEMRIPQNRNYQQAVAKFTQRSLNNNCLPLALVAIEDSLPVGSVSLIENELYSHSHLSPWVATLFVSSHYRGKGIGLRLMQEIELVASKSLGFKRLFLYTDSAAEYYRKINWQVVEVVKPQGRPESVLMSKQLI
ncbi:GNAT family N-acetyltransferase [Paenibacillus sp. BC26]|uniref:GNAT family N-acetyltransferase n=1 Tax=Paenibacillus sp. BC26 TaxID=1881032 RepID=UPI0008F33D1D|nr:GNAT family N-acetyltransferase [Paenibacillus sp. BC26]SFS77500.1 Acetyltransferase (GNAT) family protein [Paenibacillus sp. BC26]